MLGLTQGGGQAPPTREHNADSATDARARGAGGGEQQFAPLIRTIESEIIPRLLLAHKGAVDARGEDDLLGERPSADHVLEFAGLVLSRDATAAARYVEAMVDQGFRLETLYLELLAPAARHLGELWEQDFCDFVDVTMALGRVQHVLREFSPLFRETGNAVTPRARRILLTPAPGEQHSMGLMMVKEFFIRGGWEAIGGANVPAEEVGRHLAAEWFDCVGVSVGGTCRLDGLAAWIAALRNMSRNPTVAVLLGGPHFVANPELAAFYGADGTAVDARAAVQQAERLTTRTD